MAAHSNKSSVAASMK